MKPFLLNIWNKLTPTQKVWAKGLAAAVEGALTGFFMQALADPSTLNLHDWRHFAGAVLGAVVQAVRQYVRQSPLPRETWTDDQRAQNQTKPEEQK